MSIPGQGLAAAASNAVTGEVVENQRWMKLYRKIYNLFLFKDMTHKTDFENTISTLNKRIEQLETNLASYVAQVNSAYTNFVTMYDTHNHAGLGGAPTTMQVVPQQTFYTKTSIPTIPLTAANIARNQEVFAWGEELKPLPINV